MQTRRSAPGRMRDSLVRYYATARLAQETEQLAVRGPEGTEQFIADVVGELIRLQTGLPASSDELTCDHLRLFLRRIDAIVRPDGDERLMEAHWLLKVSIAMIDECGSDQIRPQLRMIEGGGNGGVSRAPLRVV
jgi:hypothetical protein